MTYNLAAIRRKVVHSLSHSPNAIEHVSVGKNSDIDVGHEDVVKAALFLIAEERVGHPHLRRVGHRQVFDLGCNNKS